MINKNIENRYFDYILIYANTVLELWEELEEKCKKKSWGEVVLKRKKYLFFATKNGVTLLNKKTDLEITFSFNTTQDYIYFEKYNLHSFIESDLNASGLWKYFIANKTVRSEDFDKCLEKLCLIWKIKEKDNGLLIWKDEIM